MKVKTVKDLNVKNKRVLLRVDYNVPIVNGVVGDSLRIEASFDTIRYLLSQNCSIVLISHLGRPDGKPDKKYSLSPVAQTASQMLGMPVGFVEDCVGPGPLARARGLKSKEIILLENLRFHGEEEANDPEFAKQLAELGEVFIDDAFAAIHRAHASTVGVVDYLPSAIGFLVEREVRAISDTLSHPTKPLVAVVGGAKVSTKIEVLENLLKHVDKLAIGGAMANTFLAAQGKKIGTSMYEPDALDLAKKIMQAAIDAEVRLVLPQDVIVAKAAPNNPSKYKADIKNDDLDIAKEGFLGVGRLVDVGNVEVDDRIVDIGPKTISQIINPIDFHGSVIWNGPLGVTEIPAFANGSIMLSNAIIESGAKCIIGGGDTAAFVNEHGLQNDFSWVSTGGGASLELMAGRELPGIKAIQEK